MSNYKSESVSRSDCTPWRDEQTLRHFYKRKEYSLLETAEVVGCTEGTVSQWCDRLDIETRDAQKARDTGTPPELEDGDWLEREYLNDERRCSDIAEELNCTPTTVSRWLRRHGIPTRPANAPQNRTTATCVNCGGEFETIQARSDAKYCSRECYYDDMEMPTGKDHWSWKEGTYRRYTGHSWYTLRKRCMKRDQYRCQNCGKQDRNDGHFDVHHIRPLRNFSNPEDANTLDNVIYLCRPCHKRIERFAPLLPPNL